MDSDLYLVLGIVIGVLAIPAIVGAWARSRPPRSAAIMVMIAGGLTVLAILNQPGGYSFSDVPDVFMRVLGRYLH